MDAEFFLAVLKQKWDEVGGRVLLCDKTRGGEIMLWQIRFQCDLTPLCMHIQSSVCILISDRRTIRLAPNRTYASNRGVSVHT
jgi:hypothetical protein